MTEFLAALAGALIAGSISGVLQWLSFKEQHRIRRAERRVADERMKETRNENEAVLAFSIMMKINRALTGIQQMKEQIDKGFLESVSRKMEFANAVQTLSSDPDRISFTIEEMALVRHFRKSEIANDLIDLPGILDLYIDNLAVIRNLKSEVSELAKTIEIDRYGRAFSSYDERNAQIAKLKIFQANQLLRHLLGRGIVDYPKTHRLFSDFQSAATDRLGRSRLKIEWDLSGEPVFRRGRD